MTSLPSIRREVLDASVLTFEQRIADLKAICHAHVFGPPPDYITAGRDGIDDITLADVAFDVGAEEHTVGWYASAILSSITVVEMALVEGDASRAASEAVVLGSLVTAAEARLTWPEIASWNAYCEKQRRRAIAGVATKADKRARKKATFRDEVQRMEASQPGLSRRKIATLLVRRTGGDLNRRTVDAMTKRIERLQK